MDRRQYGNDLYKRRFDELGLSERFEFLRREWTLRDDKRFWCKCKTCGTEFITWDEVFRGRQSHLLCPSCGAASDGNDVWNRSPQCEKAMAYYAQGHSVKDTAIKFGVSEDQINNAVKARGITNGKDWKAAGREAGKRSRKEAEQRLVKRLDALGFDYLGGYANHHSKVTIKCRTCGDMFERTADFARKGNLICRNCEHEKELVRQAKRRAALKDEAERKRAEREAARAAKSLEPSAYQLSRMLLLDDVHVCKVCGNEYTLREYMKSTGTRYYRNSGYCSAECRNIHAKECIKMSHKGRRDSHRHRAVKYGCAYDSSVTLTKLIKRDGLRCAICGEMCDKNDHSWSKYSGPMYPSIDHIIPMSKGGGHVWNNVQVAHMICNSEKGDSI